MPNPLVKVEKIELDEPNARKNQQDCCFISEPGQPLLPLNPTSENFASESTAIETADPLGGGPCPFDDPVQRTRCLIQYIRLRNQRAEAELIKRNALKKQKMDAQATLQNAREGLAQAEAEQRHWGRKLDGLNRERHDVLNELKAFHQKEIERKRQREEAERQRQRQLAAAAAEEQQRMAAAAVAAAQQQQQQQQLEYCQYLKTTQNYLSQLIASATGSGGGNAAAASPAPVAGGMAATLASLPPSLAQLLLQQPAVATSAGGPNSSATSSTSSLMAAAVAAAQQQQQQQQNQQRPQSQFAHSALAQQHQQSQQQSQQQQVQTAVANLLRQHFPATGGLPASFAPTALQQSSNAPNFASSYLQHQQLEQIQSQLAAAAAQQQQMPNNLSIQTVLAAASAAMPSPNSTLAQVPNLASADAAIYHALLAAANLGVNTSSLSSVPGLSAALHQQQQQPSRHNIILEEKKTSMAARNHQKKK